jgi:hypothetical protein
VKAGYGIDVNNTGADEASISERTKAAAARTDELVAGANRQGNAVQKTQGEPVYGSPQRRQQLAESLEGKGDRESVNKTITGQDIEDARAERQGQVSGTRRPRTLRASRHAGR